MSLLKFFLIYIDCFVILIFENVPVYAKDKIQTPESVSHVEQIFQNVINSVWREGLSRSVVSLTPRSPDKYYGSNHFCTGAVITPKHVLTAAICVIGFPVYYRFYKVIRRTRNIVVVAGWQYRLVYSPELTIRIRARRIFVHPDYIERKIHNIAVIELEERFPFERSAISIANLPVVPPRPGDNCTVLSWGRHYWAGPLSNSLKRIDLTLKSMRECRNLSSIYKEESEICAVDERLHIMTPCPGDMGAPIFCNGILCGITSLTENCKNDNPVSIFVNIYLNLEWIQRAINGEISRCQFKFSSFFIFAVLNCFLILH